MNSSDESKKKVIAILGWGSLLWEPGKDFEEWIELPWATDGPEIKIEFSRISNKRSGALTLVIDPKGTTTTVAWCSSKRSQVEDAIADLRCREGTTMANIGCICLDKLPPEPKSPEKEIIAWAMKKKIDAVVWTALEGNFEKETGKPFTLAAAIAYIKALDPEGKARAAEYIWKAPDFVKTEVRFALQKEPWF
jgi:hypothetical protein